MIIKHFVKVAPIILLFILFSCVPELPTNPRETISDKMTLNCVLDPNSEKQIMFLSRWFYCQGPISQYDCNSLDFNDWSVVGADIILSVGDDTLTAEEVMLDDREKYRMNYLSYYQFSTREIHPGQVWTVYADHPDFNSIEASTIVPDSVIFTTFPGDTFNTSANSLNFTWSRSSHTFGYLPFLILFCETENTINQEFIYPIFNQEESSAIDTEPTVNNHVSYPIDEIMEQIAYFWYDDWRWGNPEYYDRIYMRLKVISMDRALFNVQRYDYRPDESVAFSAPLQIYSNVKNGGGIFGAMWTTYSKEIILPKRIINELLSR